MTLSPVSQRHMTQPWLISPRVMSLCVFTSLIKAFTCAPCRPTQSQVVRYQSKENLAVVLKHPPLILIISACVSILCEPAEAKCRKCLFEEWAGTTLCLCTAVCVSPSSSPSSITPYPDAFLPHRYHYNVQRQTTVTDYFKSKQLPLFAFTGQHSKMYHLHIRNPYKIS